MIQDFKVIKTVLFDTKQKSLIDFYKRPIINVKGSEAVLIFRKSMLDGEEKHFELENSLQAKGNYTEHELVREYLDDRLAEFKKADTLD